MTKLTTGSPEWFKHCRRQANEAVRAHDCLVQAERMMARLHRDWGSLDNDLKAALFAAGVMHYARPFSDQPDYGGKTLKRQQGFDKELHKHILYLRNRLIAHHDNEVLHALARQEYMGGKIEGTEASFLIGTIGIVKALEGLKDRSGADRYSNHFRACAACLGEIADEKLRMLYTATVRSRKNAGVETASKVMDSVPIRPGSPIALPSMDAAGALDIPEPKFGSLATAYKYRRSVRAYRPEQSFEINTPAGKAIFDVKDGKVTRRR